MPPYILFVHKIFACPDIHLYVLVHSNVRIECMQSKADGWLFLLVRRDEIDCKLFQVMLFFGICVRPHINIHNVYANTCAVSHGKQSCTWRLGEFLSNCSRKNYCKSCRHNAGEGEYWNKFTVGNITSSLFSILWLKKYDPLALTIGVSEHYCCHYFAYMTKHWFSHEPCGFVGGVPSTFVR